MNRILSHNIGEPGPLFVVTAAMHGNEQAGIRAIDMLDKKIKDKFIRSSAKKLKGTFVGLVGNMQAVRHNVRYIQQDLNRLWETEFVYSVLDEKIENQENEIRELHEIIAELRKIVMTGKYNKLYLLDLHTTSSDGIFAICTEDEESIRLAKQLHAPVVRGLLKGISGTTLHYFNRNNLGINASALAFEAGQHDDPVSANRMMAAVINCMRSLQMISPDDIDNTYDEILMKYSENLPKSVEVIYKYTVQNKESWEMVPGFKNFDKIKKDQLLATDNDCPVYSPLDGLILMPLYQKKGRDGFFIVQPAL
jgi:succinylglutamate desuccinylase